MIEITPVQLAVHEYIQRRILEDWPPTTGEICAHMKWSALNSASTVLAALQKKGYIRTVHSKPRAIKVLIWTVPRVSSDRKACEAKGAHVSLDGIEYCHGCGFERSAHR